MGVNANLTGLNNFMRRLKKVKQIEVVKDRVSSNVADKGVELAKTAYLGSGISRAEISKETSVDGDYAVVASGEGLAFEEYGTGYYADGTYEGNLPTQTITFESAGKQRSTQGWDYYYDNPDTKITFGGTNGWMLGSNFMIGEAAGNQMYDTSVKLGEQAPKVVKKVVKELLE